MSTNGKMLGRVGRCPCHEEPLGDWHNKRWRAREDREWRRDQDGSYLCTCDRVGGGGQYRCPNCSAAFYEAMEDAR